MGEVKRESGGSSDVFMPRTSAEVQTIFVVEKARLADGEVLHDLLRSLGAPGDTSAHLQRLRSRSLGELNINEQGRKLGFPPAIGFTLEQMEEAFGYPIYRCGTGEASFRWTLDVFNPLNQECRLDCHEPDKEYLSIVVSKKDFAPLEMIGKRPIASPDLRLRYSLLMWLIKRSVEVLGSTFALGGSYSHLYNFCLAFHFGKYSRPMKLRFEKFFWPWAVYPPALRSRMRVAPEKVRPPNEHHPNRALCLEDLPDGSLLAYTLENCEDDEWQYAEALGLKEVFDLRIDRQRLPDCVESWD